MIEALASAARLDASLALHETGPCRCYRTSLPEQRRIQAHRATEEYKLSACAKQKEVGQRKKKSTTTDREPPFELKGAPLPLRAVDPIDTERIWTHGAASGCIRLPCNSASVLFSSLRRSPRRGTLPAASHQSHVRERNRATSSAVAVRRTHAVRCI